MKRIFITLLSIVLILTMTSCGLDGGHKDVVDRCDYNLNDYIESTSLDTSDYSIVKNDDIITVTKNNIDGQKVTIKYGYNNTYLVCVDPVGFMKSVDLVDRQKEDVTVELDKWVIGYFEQFEIPEEVEEPVAENNTEEELL